VPTPDSAPAAAAPNTRRLDSRIDDGKYGFSEPPDLLRHRANVLRNDRAIDNRLRNVHNRNARRLVIVFFFVGHEVKMLRKLIEFDPRYESSEGVAQDISVLHKSGMYLAIIDARLGSKVVSASAHALKLERTDPEAAARFRRETPILTCALLRLLLLGPVLVEALLCVAWHRLKKPVIGWIFPSASAPQ
jgi:hypothetical protein